MINNHINFLKVSSSNETPHDFQQCHEKNLIDYGTFGH
jgi:hypothetical protein